jgi:hypothetical protein
VRHHAAVTSKRPRLSPHDELFVHQIPEPVLNVAVHHQYWRESHFFIAHPPEGLGDVLVLTAAHHASREVMDTIQLGRVGDRRLWGYQLRPTDGDTTPVVGPTSITIVEPWKEARLWADPEVCVPGLDLTFTARTAPYALRRGTMKAGHEVIWDQSHLLQSGWFSGTYTLDGATVEVDRWWGQRDHSWGIREHGRCPLWLWFQIQLEDGFLGVWHWELENGARIYTDGCWAPTDGSDPVPLVDFSYDIEWTDASGAAAPYAVLGEGTQGLAGTCRFTLAGGRTIEVTATGRWCAPYEPMHRGGLNQMTVETDDGRTGTAIYEVTGARHHHFFPDGDGHGVLPG